MEKAPNKNPVVVIPLAIAGWLGGILVFATGAPAVSQVLFVIAFAIAVPVAVLYLIGESGWRSLARRYRASEPYGGVWRLCATGQMALVSVHHPEFHKVKMRFVGGSLKVASTQEALHLSTMLSMLPILGLFFPALRIGWTSIARVSQFEAPGWFAAPSVPEAMMQAGYDPNYTGRFIEIETEAPVVFIQLPAAILGDALDRLSISPPNETTQA